MSVPRGDELDRCCGRSGDAVQPARQRLGLVESQGCINLTWADGEYLFSLTRPTVADGDVARWAIGATPATPVLIVR